MAILLMRRKFSRSLARKLWFKAWRRGFARSMEGLATSRMLELSSAAARLRAELAVMPDRADVGEFLLSWARSELQIDMARCARLISEALKGAPPSWDGLDFIERSAPTLRSHARRMRRLARSMEMGWSLEHWQEDHLGECCAMLNRMRAEGRIDWPNRHATALATRRELSSWCPVDGVRSGATSQRL